MSSAPFLLTSTRGAVALLAFALALAAAPAAALAQTPVAGDEEGVSCDAEFLEDEDGVIYEVAAGQTVECTAFGLDAEVDAIWRVDFFDFEVLELLEPSPEPGEEPVASVGETAAPAADGTLTFDFAVPDDIGFGVFEGFVRQGEAGAETYIQEFIGFIGGELALAPMECAPDPARQGETVECVVEELAAGEFGWQAFFLTARELFDPVAVEDEEDFPEGDVLEVGTADEDGVGTFGFDVPTDRRIDLYIAIVEQDGQFALYAGGVDPATAGAPKPAPKPAAVTPATPTPVAVPRPKRVETGAGGAAPTSDQPLGLLLAALVLATGGVAVRHRRAEVR